MTEKNCPFCQQESLQHMRSVAWCRECGTVLLAYETDGSVIRLTPARLREPTVSLLQYGLGGLIAFTLGWLLHNH